MKKRKLDCYSLEDVAVSGNENQIAKSTTDTLETLLVDGKTHL